MPCRSTSATNLKLDVRDTDAIPLDDVEAIIHLANIANDPAVELNLTLSWEVNVLAGQQLADRAVRWREALSLCQLRQRVWREG